MKDLLLLHTIQRLVSKAELIVLIQMELLFGFVITQPHVGLCANSQVGCLETPVMLETVKLVRQLNVEFFMAGVVGQNDGELVGILVGGTVSVVLVDILSVTLMVGKALGVYTFVGL